MTSKNLFFKLIKQDFKKRIWCPILIFIGYFLLLEVNMLMSIENIQKYPKSYRYDVSTYVRDYFFGFGNGISGSIVICLTAFLCAISGFAYLHSKVQLDTYHSLPVSRTQLFWSKYVSGILWFLIPFGIHVLTCAGIAASKNAFTRETTASVLSYIGIQLVIFILSYSVSIIAVEITGNIIISMLGTLILFSYSAIIAILTEAMFGRFFHTYEEYAVRFGGLMSEKIWCFSPFSMIYKLFTNPKGITPETANEVFQYDDSYLWVLIAAAILYSLAAYITYLKRESEAAGRTIAFGVIEPVIKTMTVIPAAFFSGIFFSELSPNSNSESWFLFGLVFGYVILCIFMEIIFRMDLKGAFAHKKQFLFNAVCTALIFVVFRNDVLGYNTYVPSDSQLQSCAVYIDGLMNTPQRIPLLSGGELYISNDAYCMRNMEIQGNPSVMELARKAAEDGLEYTEFDYYDGIEKTAEYIETRERESSYKSISFGYKLLNGDTIYRRYVIDIDDVDTFRLLSDVFNDYDYKIGAAPLFANAWNMELAAVRCQSNFKSDDILLTAGKQSKLLATYQEEYTKLTLEEVMNTIPIGTVEFITKDKMSRRYSSYSDGMLVYPQFEETLALLKEYGFDMEEKITAEEVEAIEVTDNTQDYEAYYDHYAQGAMTYAESESITTEYTDKEQIQQILDSIVYDGFTWQVWNYNNFADDSYTVVIRLENEGTSQLTHSFIKGQIPEFIAEK